MSCIIVLQEHVEKIDLVKLSQNNVNTCYLAGTNNFIKYTSDLTAEGCYLFCNRVKGEWIRSGKCAGRLIQEHLKEHMRHAKFICNSNFYRSYPLGTFGYKGKYEWLNVCIGLECFPLVNNLHFSFYNNDKISWNAATNTIKNSKNSLEVKHNYTTYLFELCYDLMLSNAANVLRNPGFELHTG